MPDDTAGTEDHATRMPLRPIPRPFAPLAQPVPDATADTTAPSEAGPGALDLRAGCYRISFRPNATLNVYHGTMRVDVGGGATTISGDLYRFFLFPWPLPTPALQAVEAGDIPIYARNRYYSYLRVIGIQRPPILTTEPCRLVLTAQEYVYTQPPAGSFNGTFPAAPGTRTVTIELEHRPPPIGFPSVYAGRGATSTPSCSRSAIPPPTSTPSGGSTWSWSRPSWGASAG
jgi:hypothetical protein